jgi:hypothetical protein
MHTPRASVGLVAIVACLVTLGPGAAAAVSLDDMAKDAATWRLPVDQFLGRYRDAEFRWVAVHETARSVATNITFANNRSWESLVHFASNHPAAVTLSIYNRGDTGSLGEQAFTELVATVQSNLTVFAGARSQPPRSIQGAANVELFRATWNLAATRMSMEWSYTPARRFGGITQPFRSEYIRIVLTPLRGGGPATAATPPVRMTVLDLRARVARAENGDVSLTGIPMVDQGQKGYCAAAVTERVLRYFGQDIDQHHVAQVAHTTSEMGTSPEDLIKALRRIATSLNLNMRTYEAFTFDDFEKLLKDYNRVAVKEDHPILQIGHFLIVTDLYDMMEPEILKRARTRRSSDMERFMSTIRENIDTGVPVLWSVILGKIDENPRLRIDHASGHLRLIHGYNAAQQYVIYSDTWGAGHERKYMPLEDAWTITTGLWTVKPVGVR